MHINIDARISEKNADVWRLIFRVEKALRINQKNWKNILDSVNKYDIKLWLGFDFLRVEMIRNELIKYHEIFVDKIILLIKEICSIFSDIWIFLKFCK